MSGEPSARMAMLLNLMFLSCIWSECSALLCYSCSNLKTNEQCFNVTKCPDHEHCFGRTDGQLDGKVTHTTGCTNDLVAPRNNGSSGFTFCARTCTDNLCNLYSCMGENDTRPVRCLECDIVASPDECTIVKLCASNEVCFSQKFHTYGNIRYRMGCMDRKHCDTHPRTPVQTLVGRRATDTSECDVCCMQDHCNVDACSQTPSTTTYQLNSMFPYVVCNDPDVDLCTTFGRLDPDSCKEDYVFRNCPKSCDVCDHVGWSSWQPWGGCETTCELGTKTRTRQCLYRLRKGSGVNCPGSQTESSACYINVHCPITGGWCYVTNRYDCQHAGSSSYNCKWNRTKTTCDCPTPMYGGRSCH